MAIRYSQAEKTRALELYKQHGAAQAAKQTGIASATIRQWASRGGVTVTRVTAAKANVQAARLTWAQRRAELTVASGELAAELLARIWTLKPREARDLAAAYAVVVDRAQLLSGDATQRVETSDQFNREVGRLLGEFERRDELRPAQPYA